MSYLGDFRLGDTIDTKFTTVSTIGAPTTLAGTPVISAYVGNGLTEITAGITLIVDFDARTGLHNVRVVVSGANGFATATNVQLVITTGTVGGTSVVGYVIAEFSIENREVNVTRVGGTAQTAGDIIARLPTALVGGRMDASVGAMAAAVITAAAHAAGAIDAAAIATDAIGSAEFSQAAADKVFGSGGATLAELAQGIPAATPRPDQAMMALYMSLRNLLQITSTEKRVTNDAGTVIFKKALSDDGTVYAEAEAVSGP